MSARDKANRVLIHVILILVSITMLVPFLWMILTAFKTMTEATSVNPFVILPSTWRWDSFKEVIENMDFLHLYINTLLLILGRVVCAVLTATLAGYAFGRLNFRGKNLMFSLVLFQMMVDEVYLYKWNRKYPSDVKFPKDMLNDFKLEGSTDFEGNSHEKITEERYVRKK